MPLSDDAFKKWVAKGHLNQNPHEFAAWVLNKTPQPAPADAEKPPKRGEMIYVPHDCELPDPWETTLGSIWACYGYRDGRMCYDQWILESQGGAKRWVLFKRNIRG
jgi:hypothetical protein